MWELAGRTAKGLLTVALVSQCKPRSLSFRVLGSELGARFYQGLLTFEEQAS